MNGELKEYEITYEGTLQERYYVQARDPDHALEVWYATTPNPDHSEMIDGEIKFVEEIPEDD